MLGVEASDEPRRSEWTIAPIYMSQSHVRPARANEAKGRPVELIELVERTHRVQDLAERNGRRVERRVGEGKGDKRDSVRIFIKVGENCATWDRTFGVRSRLNSIVR